MDEQENYEYRLLRTKFISACGKLEKSRTKVHELTDQIKHQQQSINHLSAELGRLKRKLKHA